MTAQTESLATLPIPKLFVSMALPIVFGLMVNGLYNVVDAIFVTRGVGPLAIGGVSVVFPLQMLIFSISGLIGAGAASIISRALGRKDIHKANRVAGNALFSIIILAVVISATGLYFLEPFLSLLGARSDVIFGYAYDYALPIVSGAFIIMFGGVLNELLRSEGKTKVMSMILLLSSVLNIVLDALFIFVLEMGVMGAAMATILSQFVSLLIALYFFLSGKTAITLQYKFLKFDTESFKRIVALGIPTFIGNAGVSLSVGLANFLITQHAGINADVMISAYGVVSRVIIFAILPLIGMMIAFQTICGFNYGAQNYDRVLKVLNLSLWVTTIYTLSCALIMVFIPTPVIYLFTTDAVLVGESVNIGRMIFFMYGTAGVGFIGGGLFQAIGKAKLAMFLSTSRVFMFLLPLLIILPPMFGTEGIWMAYPVADFFAFAVAVVFIRSERKKLIELAQQPAA